MCYLAPVSPAMWWLVRQLASWPLRHLRPLGVPVQPMMQPMMQPAEAEEVCLARLRHLPLSLTPPAPVALSR